jgi:3',5'-cyclic AMP phosphodiesterase CpdA
VTDTVGNWDAWNYRDDLDDTATGADTSLVGYHVEATDGGIGKIDEATGEVGARYLVVDTGPWIFGSKVLLPAGVVTRIDRAEEKVYVDRSKDQIKNAPEYDADKRNDDSYRGQIGGYYGGSNPL